MGNTPWKGIEMIEVIHEIGQPYEKERQAGFAIFFSRYSPTLSIRLESCRRGQRDGPEPFWQAARAPAGPRATE
jgi:hypothetical protein